MARKERIDIVFGKEWWRERVGLCVMEICASSTDKLLNEDEDRLDEQRRMNGRKGKWKGVNPQEEVRNNF